MMFTKRYNASNLTLSKDINGAPSPAKIQDSHKKSVTSSFLPSGRTRYR